MSFNVIHNGYKGAPHHKIKKHFKYAKQIWNCLDGFFNLKEELDRNKVD